MSTESDPDRSPYIRRLIATIECANCGAKYSLDDIHVLGHRGGLWVSAVVCGQCGTQGLIFAMVQDEENIEIVADMEVEEKEDLESLPEISVNEILDLRLFLRDYSGDFSVLFGDLVEGEQEEAPGPP